MNNEAKQFVWYAPKENKLIIFHFSISDVLVSSLLGNPPPRITSVKIESKPGYEAKYMIGDDDSELHYLGEL